MTNGFYKLTFPSGEVWHFRLADVRALQVIAHNTSDRYAYIYLNVAEIDGAVLTQAQYNELASILGVV